MSGVSKEITYINAETATISRQRFAIIDTIVNFLDFLSFVVANLLPPINRILYKL